jgi:hypothetical protein
MGMHTGNLKSFLDKSASCWFVTVYARDEIDHKYNASTPWVPNMDDMLDDFQQKGVTASSILDDVSGNLSSNFAWATVHRENPNEKKDVYRGAVVLGVAVAKVHDIPTSPDDIVAVSRPDIVFSHAIDAIKLATVAKQIPFVLLPHHEADSVGGNDPSEMLTISTRSFWQGVCIHKVGPGEVQAAKPGSNDNLSPDGVGCLEHTSGCGYFGSLLVYAAEAMDIHPFFYNTEIKLHIHRLDGDFKLGVMRPVEHDGLTDPDSNVVGTVDLTAGATCVVGHTDACTASRCGCDGCGCRSSSNPPDSERWGPTTFTAIKPENSGLWVCNANSDIDVPASTATPTANNED